MKNFAWFGRGVKKITVHIKSIFCLNTKFSRLTILLLNLLFFSFFYIQKALSICGLAIRGFDYPPILFFNSKTLYPQDFPWSSADFYTFCLKNMNSSINRAPLLSMVLVLRDFPWTEPLRIMRAACNINNGISFERICDTLQ